MPSVLVTPAPLVGLCGPYLDVLREAGFAARFSDRGEQLTEAEVIEILPGYPAVIAGSEPYTPRVIERCPELRIIARAGVGYDSVDIPAATARGIPVTITPGANHDSVAEHTFSLILGLAKGVAANTAALKLGTWQRKVTVPLRRRTLGVVGLGRIGKAVALRGRAFLMRVIACESIPDLDFVAKNSIELMPLARLLAESEFVSLHLPMSAETRQIINRKTLSLMKPTAYLVNTARGGLVNEADLYDALTSGRLAGAALDVFDCEPPGRIPLISLDNVVATPHLAGIDVQSMLDMALMAARSIVGLSRGEWPVEVIVNPEARQRFWWLS